jgi:hypothetical protein
MSAPRFTDGWVYNLHEVPEYTEAGRVIALALTLSVAACSLVALRLGIRWKTIHTIGVCVRGHRYRAVTNSVTV